MVRAERERQAAVDFVAPSKRLAEGVADLSLSTIFRFVIAIGCLVTGVFGCLVSWMSMRDRIRLNRRERVAAPVRLFAVPVALGLGSIIALGVGVFLVYIRA